MTPADKLTEALEALDHARRALEQLESIVTGDTDIDEAVFSASADVEAHIAALRSYQDECVEEPV